MKKSLPLFLSLLLAAASLAPTQARRVKTKITPDKPAASQASMQDGTFSLLERPDSAELKQGIVFYGFDKPLSSNKESVLIQNDSPFTLEGFKIELSYLSLSGSVLHKQTIERSVHVPPGESRQVTYPSFDKQKSYCYVKSQASARRSPILFSVAVRVLDLRFAK